MIIFFIAEKNLQFKNIQVLFDSFKPFLFYVGNPYL